MKINTSKIPQEIKDVSAKLIAGGYDAYIVGGCVRDLIIGRNPKDWDLTTNATPEQMIPLFEKTFYENDFGTVGVVISDETTVEVTPYRLESAYSDNRHPDKVTFSDKLEDDLKRRDFSINALAADVVKGDVVDNFNGVVDLESKTIRAVGNPDKRFTEDALRLIRAIRFSAELGFTIEHETQNSIIKHSDYIRNISIERIRDEVTKIIASDNPMMGFVFLEKLGLLKHFLPEISSSVGVTQNQAHSFDVFEHLLRSLQHAADKQYPFYVRVAALLHDVGKPISKRNIKGGKDCTFYGHEVIGARMANEILKRMKFTNENIKLVTTLVRWHMFFSDTEQISLSAVRRIIRNVGPDHIWDLVNLRICDRIGTGRPKEDPYRLRKYMSMIEEVLREPVSVSKLKIGGNELMKLADLKPGPKIGFILNILLEEVIDNQEKNNSDFLKDRALELNKFSLEELKKLNEQALKAKENAESLEIQELRDKHRVN